MLLACRALDDAFRHPVEGILTQAFASCPRTIVDPGSARNPNSRHPRRYPSPMDRHLQARPSNPRSGVPTPLRSRASGIPSPPRPASPSLRFPLPLRNSTSRSLYARAPLISLSSQTTVEALMKPAIVLLMPKSSFDSQPLPPTLFNASNTHPPARGSHRAARSICCRLASNATMDRVGWTRQAAYNSAIAVLTQASPFWSSQR